ncbi:hypothetical protein BofuT4_uP059060.1 [Botrytis cinerea T4]|uniref:Uncharacterized protein n=1 Tax=Botryotinia fuckeliana (strain T4) TaxID=999810 RepID=G2XV06_BOTF4|nr:hypothetical protein BofuT4_uP059060.1 [Botrytis cinerea T4]
MANYISTCSRPPLICSGKTVLWSSFQVSMAVVIGCIVHELRVTHINSVCGCSCRHC